MASLPQDASSAPTPDQIAAAQAVMNAASAATIAAAALRIKPITDLAASDAAKTVLAALEAMAPAFVLDQTNWASINCALTGLRGLGVTAATAS